MRAAPKIVPIVLFVVGCGAAGSASDADRRSGSAGAGGAMGPPEQAGGAGVAGFPAFGGTTSGGGSTGAGGNGAGGIPVGTGGTVIVSRPDAGNPYDRTVTFDWPETLPPAGKCEPGTYVGTFSCELTFIPGFPPGQVTGPVTFTLSPSASGEFLEIKNGRLDATANGTTPFGSDLMGKLDCGTRVFHADAPNGTWGTAPFTGTFFGDMDGSLDGLTNVLSGTWSLTAGTMAMPSASPCKGPWSATKQ